MQVDLGSGEDLRPGSGMAVYPASAHQGEARGPQGSHRTGVPLLHSHEQIPPPRHHLLIPGGRDPPAGQDSDVNLGVRIPLRVRIQT